LLQPDKTSDNELRFTFASNSMAARAMLHTAISGLRYLDLSDEDSGTIELVLAEAVNNIVEHAYPTNPNGMIRLQITPMENGLLCALSDNGCPMPVGVMTKEHRASLNCDVENLPEGGFGLFLINGLTHGLSYTRKGDMNQLSFLIPVTLPQLNKQFGETIEMPQRCRKRSSPRTD